MESVENCVKDTISESSQSASQVSVYSDSIKDIPKKHLNAVLFIGCILQMVANCQANSYYVYGSGNQMEAKGKVMIGTLTFTVVVLFVSFFILTSLKEFIRLFILFDTIMLVTLAAGLAFINLILIFHTEYHWYWIMLEVGFSIQLIGNSTMTRILLVHMKWSKWRLIAFKICAFINSLGFLVQGTYFILVNFSYTMHMLPAFDSKVKDFMLLYIFSLFAYTYQIYSKITDMDYTGDLRYCYTLKNMDENLTKKRQSFIKKRRQSMNSVNLFNLNGNLRETIQAQRISRFANIQNLN